jgi:hypothetical protein
MAALVPIAGLIAQAFMEHRDVAKNAGREDGISALAVQTAEEAQLLKATTDSLRMRVRMLERGRGRRTVMIVDTVAVRKKPENHGLWWHFTHIDGKEH